MTSAASPTVATGSAATWLQPIGRVLAWPAVVVCLILLVASSRPLAQTASA